MQSRQPLQTSGWMYTVSNSVRMMALVGHTSMQLASEQCLHTSLIMLHATPPFGAARSRNSTCRQFCSSSRPVLSKLSMNLGAWPGSWFHSLQATSHALQPMQSVVSVKKPLVISRHLFRWLWRARKDIYLLRSERASCRERVCVWVGRGCLETTSGDGYAWGGCYI